MTTDDSSRRLEWREEMLEELVSNDAARSTQALLSLTYNDPDRPWLEELLLRQVSDARDPQVRLLAVTCMGHLGRIHGEIGGQIVRCLENLLDDAELAGTAEDALGDIRHYATIV